MSLLLGEWGKRSGPGDANMVGLPDNPHNIKLGYSENWIKNDIYK